MLHILLLILKIIGIILLVLVGLLLLIVLTVLLVPVRYRLSVEHGDELFRAEGTISWLLHFLHVRITMKDTKPLVRIRILGKVIFDNQKVKVKKRRRKFKRESVKRATHRKDMAKNTDKKIHTVQQDKKSPEHLQGYWAKNNQSINEKKDTDLINEEISFERVPLGDEKINQQPGYKSSVETKNNEIPKIETKENEDGKENHSLFQKIIIRIKRIKDNIITFLNRIRDKIKKWKEVFVDIRRKVNLLLDFIKDEINREAFRLTYSSLLKLLKHILPKKLKSKVVFGTGDPCSTGQVLGALGILYGFYGDKIQITPDFENKRFEGSHYARGRIRLVTILIIVIKLILDKRFKKLTSNMKILKEAL